MPQDRKRHLLLTFIALGLASWFALDGRHYWHEIRFIYASTQFDLAEVLSGAFNPHQLGGVIDEVSAGGFYSTKAMHILGVKSLFALISPEQGGFVVAAILAWSTVIGVLFVIQGLLRRLQVPGAESGLVLLACVTLPAVPYLAGKALSEVPSLLSVGVALRALVFSLEHRSTQRIVGIAFSGLSLMLAALMRLDMTLCFFGFLVAALLLPQKAFRRAELIRVAPVVLFVGCLGYLACAGILGIPIASFRPYFDSFVQLETKSNAMSVLGVLSFGGAGYLLAGLGLLCVTRAAGFLLVWLGLTVIPMIVITANYMVEPRYLSCAVIPLAGLVTIGLSRIDRLRGRAQRLVLPAVVVVAVVSSALFIPLMPYEVDRPALTRAVGEVLDRDPNAAILVPWAYTDFHFLRLTLPDRPVYNVNTPGGSLAAISGPWRARLDDWYGINYLDDPDRLSELLTHQHAYYVGWRWYPPMENALHFAERFGLDAVANRLRRLGLMDHRTQSWLWNDPRFDLEPAGRAGQYEVFRVSPASVSVTTAGAGNALARSNESSPELPGRPHRLAPVDRAGLR